MNFDVQSMYQAVSTLLEILEREEDILEAERIQKSLVRQYLLANIRYTDVISTLTSFGKCDHGQVGKGIREVPTATKSVHTILG
ncbi:unnamed protein product [Protopolystoma xenopodis]|uniref:Uncharacterized protein n=1 Tax=Protopolystoma xenopodis TaxID=117903 RepID=A0A448WW06_9PLAT|nr:unnamed protein product [Protopolystoma xenopodis]